jgi:transcriptional regulator GlxA family with amidase domain
MEEKAADHLTIADIAAAVHFTLRTLQLTFRRHLDSTPTEYLRRIRMHRAHIDLCAADPAIYNVINIAVRWGFAHAGRFAREYKMRYGQNPSATLKDVTVRCVRPAPSASVDTTGAELVLQ